MEEEKRKLSLILPLIIAAFTITKSDKIYKIVDEKMLQNIGIERLENKTEELLDNKINELGLQIEIDEENSNRTVLRETANLQNSNGKTNNFVKYDLSYEQLKGLAAVAFSEQGSTAEGAATEASLMANLFEIHKKGKFNEKTGGDGLYEFVGAPISEGGWFEDASNYIDSGCLAEFSDGTPVTEEMINVVREVLCEGKRTIPGYIDEHDSWGRKNYVACNEGEEITRDREEYKKNVTYIRNKHGSSYTFWGWADDSGRSDAFGYTDEAAKYKEEIGEAYYDFKTGKLINEDYKDTEVSR